MGAPQKYTLPSLTLVADQKEIIIQGNEGVPERVLPCFRQSLDDSSPGLNIQL